MRTRPGWVEPEVWFRIAHVVEVGHQGAPVAAYREQLVEIALGPKGAFENGNIGALRLRAPTSRVVPSLHPCKPAIEPRIPRVVELLRKAIEWQVLLESGKLVSQADIARREGVTRARVTQVMGMLRLVPEIQEQIQSLPGSVRRPSVTERALRPIAQLPQGKDQLHVFQEILTLGRGRICRCGI